MREYARIRPEVLQPQPSEETPLPARLVAPGNRVGLLVDVDAGVAVLVERAIGTPGRKGPPGPTVTIVWLLAGLKRRQIESHGVEATPRQKGLLLLGPDHVVWRTHDLAQITDRFGIESKTSKRSDFWHPAPPTREGTPAGSANGGGPASDQTIQACGVGADRTASGNFGPLGVARQLRSAAMHVLARTVTFQL